MWSVAFPGKEGRNPLLLRKGRKEFLPSFPFFLPLKIGKSDRAKQSERALPGRSRGAEPLDFVTFGGVQIKAALIFYRSPI